MIIIKLKYIIDLLNVYNNRNHNINNNNNDCIFIIK
jgi:hypothetical protein